MAGTYKDVFEPTWEEQVHVLQFHDLPSDSSPGTFQIQVCILSHPSCHMK